MKFFEVFTLSVISLFMLDFLFFLPSFHTYFGNDLFQSRALPKWKTNFILMAWLSSLTAIFFSPLGSVLSLLALVILFIIFNKYYISHRWNGIRRGFGAPGFMSHWILRYLLLFVVIFCFGLSPSLAQDLLLLARIDFALIMICAGTYKILIGYLKGNGMEIGAVNPIWGYFWRHIMKLPPSSILLKIQNIFASTLEILAGVLMLIPSLRVWGALIITLSFLYVALFIRLGRLAFLMSLLPLIYFDAFESSLVSLSHYYYRPEGMAVTLFEPIFKFLIYFMIGCLPVIKIMQYLNLFLNRNFPNILQKFFTLISLKWPVIIWRVFTPDVTCFFLRIYTRDENKVDREYFTDEKFYSYSGFFRDFKKKVRLLHVTESIALVSVFTTLRYFASNKKLFEEKLIHYTKTLAEDFKFKKKIVGYEYIYITNEKRFEFNHVGDFEVDLLKMTVVHNKLIPSFDFNAPEKFSPIRESAIAGTYILKE